jgi:hypothetical protein
MCARGITQSCTGRLVRYYFVRTLMITHMKVNAPCVRFAPLMFNPTSTVYCERQKYGINSLKIKQYFFSKKSLNRSILVYEEILPVLVLSSFIPAPNQN